MEYKASVCDWPDGLLSIQVIHLDPFCQLASGGGFRSYMTQSKHTEYTICLTYLIYIFILIMALFWQVKNINIYVKQTIYVRANYNVYTM